MRVIAPGTLTDSAPLEENTDNVLLALSPDRGTASLAWPNLAGGEVRVAEVAEQNLAHELRRIEPAAVLLADGSPPAAQLTGFAVL